MASLDDYQKKIDDILQGYEVPYWAPLSQLAHLVEEVGEVARAMNHKYGDKVKKTSESDDDLAGEIGDVLFNIICLANFEGVNLQKELDKTVDKLVVRDKDRFAKKS